MPHQNINYITLLANPVGRSLAGIAGSNPSGEHGCLSFVNIVCCQIEVSPMGLSLVQRSPTVYVCVCVIGVTVTLYTYN
jgi:hypothetical protein